MEKDIYRTSRFMYHCEAMLEYLISLLVTGTYLATLTQELGISDSLTGIISAFISLGCVFELFSSTIRIRRRKPFVVIFSVLNQLLFLFLYVIPLTSLGKNQKTALFLGSFAAAYLLYYIAFPKKIDWFMGLVDDAKRGRFTALKEMISLLSGMAFTFLMGRLVDTYRAAGNRRAALLCCAIAIFVVMLLHTTSMLCSREKILPEQPQEKKKRGGMRAVLGNKKLLRVILVFIVWNVGVYTTLPFYNTYQIKELGFSLTYVAVIGMVGAVARILFSFFLGSYADRHSFARMLLVCLCLSAGSFLMNVFTVPSNGKVMFLLYTVIYYMAQGGTGSAAINLIFDCSTPETRADALALNQAAYGVAGFLVTLAVSPLVSYIQRSGNRFLGLNVYAQQVTSFFAFVISGVSVLLLWNMIRKDKKPNGSICDENFGHRQEF